MVVWVDVSSVFEKTIKSRSSLKDDMLFGSFAKDIIIHNKKELMQTIWTIVIPAKMQNGLGGFHDQLYYLQCSKNK